MLRKGVLYPFIIAIAALATNPAITSDPDAEEAVIGAKAQAQKVPASTSSAVISVAADAKNPADPAISTLTLAGEASTLWL